jgi:MFS family permease
MRGLPFVAVANVHGLFGKDKFMGRQRPTIVLIWCIGVLAAAQLGKFAVLIPLMRQDLDLSLAQAGWMVSLIEVSGASLGVLAGSAVGHMNCRTALVAGTALLVLAGLTEGFSTHITVLFIGRLMESVGYLLIVIAAPALIATVALPEDRGSALALWSTFVPVGLATGAALTGGAMLLLAWHGVLLVWSLLAALAVVACLSLPARTGRRLGRLLLPERAIWLLAAGFGCYTLVEVGILALLPTYLTDQWKAAPSVAASVTAAVAASAVVGSAAASLALRWGTDHPGNQILRLISIGLLLPALMLFFLFAPQDTDISLSTGSVYALAVLLNAISGLVPAVMFARLPDLTVGSKGHVQDIAAANGVLAQFGAAGSLAGPPLLGFAVGRWGWPSIALISVVFSLASLGMTALAERSRLILSGTRPSRGRG